MSRCCSWDQNCTSFCSPHPVLSKGDSHFIDLTLVFTIPSYASVPTHGGRPTIAPVSYAPDTSVSSWLPRPCRIETCSSLAPSPLHRPHTLPHHPVQTAPPSQARESPLGGLELVARQPFLWPPRRESTSSAPPPTDQSWPPRRYPPGVHPRQADRHSR